MVRSGPCFQNVRPTLMGTNLQTACAQSRCTIGPVHLPNQEISKACRDFGVARLWLFGSASTGQFRAGISDFDFTVEFGATPEGMSLATQFFAFQERLQSILGSKVDLVERSAVTNPHIAECIKEQEVLLFAA